MRDARWFDCDACGAEESVLKIATAGEGRYVYECTACDAVEVLGVHPGDRAEAAGLVGGE